MNDEQWEYLHEQAKESFDEVFRTLTHRLKFTVIETVFAHDDGQGCVQSSGPIHSDFRRTVTEVCSAGRLLASIVARSLLGAHQNGYDLLGYDLVYWQNWPLQIRSHEGRWKMSIRGAAELVRDASAAELHEQSVASDLQRRTEARDERTRELSQV